ncbi:MAG: transposase [Candidatus Omnitrophota bacterium]
MARKARFLSEQVCYYVISTASQRQDIFIEDTDYRYYLRLVKKYKARFGVLVLGYCLLPGSAHLVAQFSQPQNISAFMQGVNQSFSLYFNRKHKSQGRVWKDRFRSIAIERAEDLFDCIKYVEFKPVKENFVLSPVEYSWSSCALRILGYHNGILDSNVPWGGGLSLPFRISDS